MSNVLKSAAIFIFTGILLSFIPQNPDIEISNEIYCITYSQYYEQPLNIEYTVKCNQFSKDHYSRKGLKFYGVDSIQTSDNQDYYKNVWDKGHMAPAAAFNCDSISLRQTFSYVNCALQHKDLNRGPWKQLEQYERELSINNDITISIQVDFSESTRLPSGAMIPTGFRKNIIKNGKLFKTYYFPNQSVKDNFENFLEKKW